jgi:hypothetical protein
MTPLQLVQRKVSPQWERSDPGRVTPNVMKPTIRDATRLATKT